MKVATAQISFVAVALILISSIDHTNGTLTSIVPTLKNYWTKLWQSNINGPASQPQKSNPDIPIWLVVANNGKEQMNNSIQLGQQQHVGVLTSSEKEAQVSSNSNQVSNLPILNESNTNLNSPQQNQLILPNLPQQNQPILPNLPQQNQPILPNLPQQNQPILPNLPKQNQSILPNLPNQNFSNPLPSSNFQNILQNPNLFNLNSPNPNLSNLNLLQPNLPILNLPLPNYPNPLPTDNTPFHIPTTHQITIIHLPIKPQYTIAPPAAAQSETQQLAGVLIPSVNIPQLVPSNQELPNIPISPNQWSSLNPAPLPGIPLNQHHNQHQNHNLFQNSVNKPLMPYPIIIESSLPAVKPVTEQTNKHIIAQTPSSTIQEHVIEGHDGFAGLPGKIQAHLTLNYVPLAEIIPLSMINSVASVQENTKTTLKATTDPLVNSSVKNEVGKEVTTSTASSLSSTVAESVNYSSAQEIVEGSGILDPRRLINEKTVSWFIHHH